MDTHQLAVTDPDTKKVDRKQILCLVLMDYRVKVIIPDTEVWYGTNEHYPDYVIRRISAYISSTDAEGISTIDALIKKNFWDNV